MRRSKTKQKKRKQNKTKEISAKLEKFLLTREI
jgi:hypothetical protein